VRLRNPERERVYAAAWPAPAIQSALQAGGVAPGRLARALELLRHRGVPPDRMGGALVLVFDVCGLKTCPPRGRSCSPTRGRPAPS
jgi:hypothetical protein